MNSNSPKGRPLVTAEVKLLLNLVETSKIINNTKTNAVTNKMKVDEWIKITTAFNASFRSCPRRPGQLRLKWENLKKLARRRISQIRKNQLNTGDGPTACIPRDEILDRVADILGGNIPSSRRLLKIRKRETWTEDNDSCHQTDDDQADGVYRADVEVIVADSANSINTNGTQEDIKYSRLLANENMDSCHQTDDNRTDGFATANSEQKLLNRTTTVDSATSINTNRSQGLKRKLDDENVRFRNSAIAEYYKEKTKMLEATKEGILLDNKRKELENIKLQLEIDKLKREL